jgi:hypothetical protein
MAIDALRQAHLKVINEAPVEVMLTRPVKEQDGAGGYIELVPEVIGPIKVRIVPDTRVVSARYSEAGEVYKRHWLIFAPHNADIRRKDRLEYEGAEMEITRVIKRWYRGEVYAVQCEAEEVS